MKKSSQVQLTLVAVMAMAGCSRPYNPCNPATFDQRECQIAIDNGGYYYTGRWYPMSYGHSYGYYYNNYAYYVSSGRSVSSAPSGSYATPAGVTRGGFGATGRGVGAGA